MSSNYVTAFLGALQASVSVILTISYGVIATQWGLFDQASSKKVSTLCVKLFLPALLFIYSLIYNIASISLGLLLVKVLNLPSWATPAITFNNSISFPLLLTQSLESTGVLENLLWGSSDSVSAAVTRAKSYFLVNAMIADSLTFGLGTRLLGNPSNEEAPDKKKEEGGGEGDDEEEGTVHDGNGVDEEEARATEETSLLPKRAVRMGLDYKQKSLRLGRQTWAKMPGWLQSTLSFLGSLVCAPLIGAMVGLFVALVPGLQTAFFGETSEGGFLNAWLTKSIENIGELFTALQVVVVGVKLSQALLNMKKGEESGPLPWKPATVILLIRFVIWPCISIPSIWALATKTKLLSDDPILWWALMLMPVGPPALKLTALADVAGAGEAEKMSIAKFLTLSYVISPVLTFAVVGAITAAQNATGQ